MPAKKYRVTLTGEEITILKNIINKGKQNAQKRKRPDALIGRRRLYRRNDSRKDDDVTARA
jgi:hypothetical protein